MPHLRTVRATLFSGLGVFILLPALLVAMPPLLDYPNHLVRFWLLSGGVKTVSAFYAVDWSHTATNIGVDVMGAILAWLFSAPVAGRIILGLSAIVPCLGCGLLAKQVHGRLSSWHILIGLNAWPLVLLCGLMSFQLSLGLALVAAWLDLKYAEQPRLISQLRRAVQGVLIVLIHPFGGALYLFLNLFLSVKVENIDWFRLFDTLCPFLLTAIVIGLRTLSLPHDAFSILTLPALQWDEPVGTALLPSRLIPSLLLPWRSYGPWLDAVPPLAFALGALSAHFRGRLSCHLGLLTLGLALMFAGLLGPQDIGSTSLVDLRCLTMATLVFPVALMPEWDQRELRLAVGFIATVLVCVRGVWITEIWYDRQKDIAALKAAVAPIPLQARVLPLMGRLSDNEPRGRFLGDISPAFEHQPTLAVLYRHAYVPTVFAESGKQPLRVLAPYDDDNEPSGGVLGTPTDLERHDVKVAAYLGKWEAEFDYILIINADLSPPAPIAGTCMIKNSGYARLYRVGNCR